MDIGNGCLCKHAEDTLNYNFLSILHCCKDEKDYTIVCVRLMTVHFTELLRRQLLTRGGRPEDGALINRGEAESQVVVFFHRFVSPSTYTLKRLIYIICFHIHNAIFTDALNF